MKTVATLSFVFAFSVLASVVLGTVVRSKTAQASPMTVIELQPVYISAGLDSEEVE